MWLLQKFEDAKKKFSFMKNLKKCTLHNSCLNQPLLYCGVLAIVFSFFKANYSSWAFLYLLLVVHMLHSSLGKNVQSPFLGALLYSLQSLHFKSSITVQSFAQARAKYCIQMSCKFQIGVVFSSNVSSFFSICEVIEVTEFYKLVNYIYAISKQLPYACTSNEFSIIFKPRNFSLMERKC